MRRPTSQLPTHLPIKSPPRPCMNFTLLLPNQVSKPKRPPFGTHPRCTPTSNLGQWVGRCHQHVFNFNYFSLFSFGGSPLSCLKLSTLGLQLGPHVPHRPPPSLPFFLSKSKSFFSSVLPTLEPSTEAFKIKPGVGLIYGLAFFV